MHGTAVLAAAVASREHKPRVFVSASAIGYYGDRGDELLTEDSAPGDDFLADVCQAWEAETQPAADAGVRTVNVRTGIVLARHGGALKQMLLPFRLGLGGKQGSGKQWMSWIALDDEIAAIRAAIDDERLRGPVNLTAPNPVTNAEFAHALGRVAAPADGVAHADVPVEAALRRRARRDAAAREPAGACPPGSKRSRSRSAIPCCSRRSKRSCAATECGSGSTPTSATIPTTRSRSGARRRPTTSTSSASARSTATSS